MRLIVINPSYIIWLSVPIGGWQGLAAEFGAAFRLPPDFTKIVRDLDAKMAKNRSVERLAQRRRTRPWAERQGRQAQSAEDQEMRASTGAR